MGIKRKESHWLSGLKWLMERDLGDLKRRLGKVGGDEERLDGKFGLESLRLASI